MTVPAQRPFARFVVDEPASRGVRALLAAAAVAFLLVSFVANEDCLLHGLDGTDWVQLFDAQKANRTPFSQTGADAFQGNFDAYYPTFREYLLPSALTLPFGSNPGKPLTYTVYGLCMLFCAYALARAVGFGRAAAQLGASLLPLLVLPVFIDRNSLLYPIFGLNPHLAQVLSLSLLTVAAFWAIPGTRGWRRAALTVAPMLCLVLGILATVPYVALMVPAAALYGGASLLDSRSRRDIAPRIGAALIMVAVPAALGMAHYVYGLTAYTAYNFFTAEFEQTRTTLYFASVLFQPGYTGKLVIALGVLGALWTAWRQTGRLRLFALTHLVVTVLFQAVAISVVLFASGYQGPAPVYFEIFVWPYALLFSAVALAVALRALLLGAPRASAKIGGWLYDRPAQVGLLCLLIAVAWLNASAAAHRAARCPDSSFFPLRATAITEHLQQAIALRPGAKFQGLAATIDGIGSKPSVSWIDLHGYDASLWQKTGNDHRSIGLRNYQIPMLFDYTSFITPPYYLLLSEFLSRPADRRLRSVLILTQADPRMLRLWGVRFVITDADPGIGHEVVTLPVEGQKSLRLVELDRPNLGDYSPTAIRHAGSYREGLALLHAPSFDGSSAVVTDASLPGPFVAATHASLVFEKSGFDIKASSSGRSLLVLPVQHSHCWRIEGTGQPVLFRANLMQLGVSFSGSLDARLVFNYGPVFAGLCRVQDMRDAERLQIRSAR